MRGILAFSCVFLSVVASGQNTGSKASEKQAKDSVVGWVCPAGLEQGASFPGGEEAMMRFINKNLQYPERNDTGRLQFRVIVSFVVNKDGSLSDIKILKSVKGETSLEAAAIRVVKMMPKWEPGTANAKPVERTYVLPIMFSYK
jgi:TonB family protein